MAFNSSALTAGIGSMIQGIQSSAQQKLQLAQMERQKRIEDANLIHQRQMEDLARRSGAEQLDDQTKTNPLRRDVLGAQRDLSRGILPSQIRSAELGVIGQDIQNRTGLFNLDELLPQQKQGMFNANKISGVQGNIAEATQGADITLRKQVPEGNQFTATAKLRAGFDEPIKTIQSALAVLNDKKMSLADKNAAYQRYNEARQTLMAMPGQVTSAEGLPSLFPDVKGMRSDYMKRIGGKEGETDMGAVIGRYAPERKAPTIADTLDIYNVVPGLIQGLMSGAASNPNDSYIDRGDYTVDIKTGPKGTYKTPSFNLRKMASGLIDGLGNQVQRAAQQAQISEQELWKIGFGLIDSDFKNGVPNFGKQGVKDRVLSKMTMGFVQNPEMQKALIATNAGYEEVMKTNLSSYLASINKGTAKAQIDATLKTLQLPMVNTYVMAMTQATTSYNQILAEMRKAGMVDPQNMTMESLLSSVKSDNDTVRRDAVTRLMADRDRIAAVIKKANETFIGKNVNNDPNFEAPDPAYRASEAITALLQSGFSGQTLPATTSPPGAAPPASSGGLGVAPGVQIAPGLFPPGP
jgi:hypothetical protein